MLKAHLHYLGKTKLVEYKKNARKVVLLYKARSSNFQAAKTLIQGIYTKNICNIRYENFAEAQGIIDSLITSQQQFSIIKLRKSAANHSAQASQ